MVVGSQLEGGDFQVQGSWTIDRREFCTIYLGVTVDLRVRLVGLPY